MKLFFISQEQWTNFLSTLSEQIEVISLEDHTHPFKEQLYPSYHTLFHYRKDTPKEQAVIEEKKRLYHGVKPCDAKTGKLLALNFLSNPHPDPYFNAIFENTIVISKACTQFDPYCFCDQIGDSPSSLNGAHGILFTLETGYHLLLNHTWLSSQLQQFGVIPVDVENETTSFDKGNIATREIIPLPIQKLREKGLSLVPKTEVWDKITDTCLACGVCTFLCPACYCFDIQDISFGRVGKRERSYDSCMFTLYTSEASGHNPRPSIKERWRQRLLHKFTYYPMQTNEIGCTGCGRCSKECPSKIDMREVIRYAAQFCE